MDVHKLKVYNYNSFKLMNFPDSLEFPIETNSTTPQVVLYYIDQVADIKNFTDFCNEVELPHENRTIMIYKKGRKDGVNRDSIIGPFKGGGYKNYKLKAPMLCSLSKDYSAVVLSKII